MKKIFKYVLYFILTIIIIIKWSQFFGGGDYILKAIILLLSLCL